MVGGIVHSLSSSRNKILFLTKIKQNQILRAKRHKKWNQECKQKQSLLFNFCNIFNLLTSRTQKISWWPPVFKPDFYIFSTFLHIWTTQENLKKIHRQVFIVLCLLKEVQYNCSAHRSGHLFMTAISSYSHIK